MPSLTNRPNGVASPPLKGTTGNILLKTQSALYQEYLKLRSDDKSILDTIMYVMGTNTNHLIVAGATLDLIVKHSGYAPSTVMSSIMRLKALHILNALQQPYEYIVNPTLAIKGTECLVWKFQQACEYGNKPIPRDVAITCEDMPLSTNY